MATTSLPAGTIIMWSGDPKAVPTGWALCNGEKGTPPLLDRFIVAAGGNYHRDQQGGNASIALTIANLPSHDHSVTVTPHTHKLTMDPHTHSFSYMAPEKEDDRYGKGDLYADRGRNWPSGTTDSTTSTGKLSPEPAPVSVDPTPATESVQQNIEILPPYYALCFIMLLPSSATE